MSGKIVSSNRAKSVVYMYAVENMTGTQIAEELNISLSNVRNILARNNIKKSEEQIHLVKVKNHQYTNIDDEHFIRDDGKHFRKMTKEEIYDKMIHKY